MNFLCVCYTSLTLELPLVIYMIFIFEIRASMFLLAKALTATTTMWFEYTNYNIKPKLVPLD